MSDIEKVSNYLTDAKVFFLATVDGDKPKARPLGLQILHDDRIYFGVGDFKEVYRQMQENPHVEIVATRGEDILRYYGVAKFDDNEEVLNIAWEMLGELKGLYDSNGWNMKLFYIDEATAEFRNMFSVEESYNFKY
ncbi:MAG: pyridoxamine 5'-phosphate oxidase family protein [Methanosphaera sp.]|nr:pyridoxamine 5'-phosphate oxidase family protein [Methanosphaera sp.]